MKNFFSLICSIALLGGVAGCSDDDDKAGFDQALLIGTWQQTERYWSDPDGEGHETVGPKDMIILTFRADGTGTEATGVNGYDVDPFTYWVDRYLWFDYGGNDRSAYEVESLTDAALILSQSGSDQDGEWIEREIYVRINE